MELYVREAAGYRIATACEIVEQAKQAIARKYRKGRSLNSPAVVEEFLRLKLGYEHNEKFVALWLDGRHRLIVYEELFSGSIDGTAIYPRVVVEKAITHSATAVIFSHQHPTGVAEPSTADQSITRRLKQALDLIDVKVLDHVIVGEHCVSLAARGLL